MKKQLTLAAAFLFIIAGTLGCKKQSEATKPLAKRMEGRWQLNKIETSKVGSETVIYTGVTGDYLDFRINENDEVEVSIAGDRYLGNYATFVSKDFNLVLKGVLLKCNVTTITDNKLEFTGTVDGASNKETRKYYLTR